MLDDLRLQRVLLPPSSSGRASRRSTEPASHPSSAAARSRICPSRGHNRTTNVQRQCTMDDSNMLSHLYVLGTLSLCTDDRNRPRVHSAADSADFAPLLILFHCTAHASRARSHSRIDHTRTHLLAHSSLPSPLPPPCDHVDAAVVECGRDASAILRPGAAGQRSGRRHPGGQLGHQHQGRRGGESCSCVCSSER